MKRAQHAAVDAFRHTICAARDVARSSSIAETLEHVLAAVRAPRPGRLMHDACEVPEICELQPSPARQRSLLMRRVAVPLACSSRLHPARLHVACRHVSRPWQCAIPRKPNRRQP